MGCLLKRQRERLRFPEGSWIFNLPDSSLSRWELTGRHSPLVVYQLENDWAIPTHLKVVNELGRSQHHLNLGIFELKNNQDTFLKRKSAYNHPFIKTTHGF